MNLSELADIVTQKVGKTDAESVAAAKTYLRQRHELVYDTALWKDTVGVWSVVAEAEVEHLVLPFDLSRPLALWNETSGQRVDITSLSRIAMTRPDALSEVGGLLTFVEVEAVGWGWALPAAGGIISFINSSTEEVTVNISGLRNLGIYTFPDLVDSQSITIPAGGGPSLSATWKRIDRMTKPRTSAPVLVGEVGTDHTWVWPSESTEAVFARVRLIPAPEAQATVGVLGKRKLRQMRTDTDQPMIRGIDNVLLAYAQADMLERSRQYAKANAKAQEAAGLLAVAKDNETNQSAWDCRIVPEVYPEVTLDY